MTILTGIIVFFVGVLCGMFLLAVVTISDTQYRKDSGDRHD